MEEVRSYWQVASIQHFCTLFQKPFKLPTFEPEELEQAFIIDVPEPPKSISSTFVSIKPHNNNLDNAGLDATDSDDQEQNHNDDDDRADQEQQSTLDSQRSSPDYLPPNETKQPSYEQPQQQPQQNEDQNSHLLVKLAIALLKPHFNSKIRLIDVNWVDLEQCPSPLNVPIISPDGIELPKCLNFRELPLSDKIDVFSALCDYRLWCEDVSELLKDYPLEELRLESIGKDSHGYEYWYFSGTRLFREHTEVSQDLICRKKRIKELEYKLIELDKSRILKEQEEKRKAELERAKQLANEAREERLASKRRQEEAAAASSATKKKRGSNTPNLPPRTGLRERRTSAASNNNESQATPSRTLRSRTKPLEPQADDIAPQSAQKTTRGSAKHSKQSGTKDRSQTTTPDGPKKTPEEECREELERITITPDERKEAWSIACDSLDEWENFSKRFEKTKSTNEKYLSSHLVNVLLPHIQGIYAKKAAEIRRKEKELMLALTTRRVSTRIISKRAQEEEDERQAQIREAEIQKKKLEAETRLRAELEREMRAKKNRFVVNGGTSSACSEDGEEPSKGYNLRQNQHDTRSNDTSEFDGIIHPDKLAEFYEALELIVDTVRTSKHAWPFVDAVPETVPGYYDLIKEPMDLKTLRTKVEFRHYKSLIELEKDFQLLVNNCEKFNGPKNVYTKMVYKLWKSFRKNVQLYLERDLHMNEYETFLYPPPPPIQPASLDKVIKTEVMIQNGNGNINHASKLDDLQQQSHSSEDTNLCISNGIKVDAQIDSHPVESGMDFMTVNDSSSEILNQPGNTSKPVLASPIKDLKESAQTLMQKSELNLQFQPTPIEVPVEIIEDGSELPPEPVCEEVIIESFAEPFPNDQTVICGAESYEVHHE